MNLINVDYLNTSAPLYHAPWPVCSVKMNLHQKTGLLTVGYICAARLHSMCTGDQSMPYATLSPRFLGALTPSVTAAQFPSRVKRASERPFQSGGPVLKAGSTRGRFPPTTSSKGLDQRHDPIGDNAGGLQAYDRDGPLMPKGPQPDALPCKTTVQGPGAQRSYGS